MQADPLSEVLRSVRPHGATFYYVSCRDAWAARTPHGEALAASIGPEAEHVVAYHFMVRGEGWVTLDGEAPTHIGCGDIVMCPRGDAHVLSSVPGLRAGEAPAQWLATTWRAPQPVVIAFHDGVMTPDAELPVDEASAVLVCGFLQCSLRPFNPLIGALPRLMHLRSAVVGGWIAAVLGEAVADCRHQRAGSGAMLERVGAMVFVDAVRRWLASLPEQGGDGWLGALRDRHVGRAIALLHARPLEPWTVAALGRQVGLSRSALHERFSARVGMPPMHYLAAWRLQLGANLLRETDRTVATIAQDVGYESEAAFSRAFRRQVGAPPAAWRRRQRAPG